MAVGTQASVEYKYDRQSKNWSFRVASLGIVGGAKTREEAEKKAAEAIAFTLEPDGKKEPAMLGGIFRRRLRAHGAFAKTKKRR
jgi:predicted RNase H-like HicB family nuclease